MIFTACASAHRKATAATHTRIAAVAVSLLFTPAGGWRFYSVASRIKSDQILRFRPEEPEQLRSTIVS